MSDWKTLDLLTPDDQTRARALFKPEEKADIADYEFSDFGPKLLRRVRAEVVKANAEKTKESGRKKAQRTKVTPVAAAIVESGAVHVLTAEGSRQIASAEIIVKAALERICDSPVNPRKSYPAAALEDMAKSIREAGIIQPLVVRALDYRTEQDAATALWVIFVRASGNEFKPAGIVKPSEAEARCVIECAPLWEIVAGHRRYRAACIAGLAEAPVIVRSLTAAQVLEIQLIENLQREDLDPIEEAHGLTLILKIKDAETGAARYNIETLALKIGKSTQHIHDKLRLLCLPENAVKAIQDVLISENVGYLIAKIPSDRLRKQATKEVIAGHGEGPFSFREARDHIRRNFTVEMRTPPFDIAHETLVPVEMNGVERVRGGTCLTCPHYSPNMPEADDRKFALCTLPTCYASKVEAHSAVVRDKALAAGGLVVTGERATAFIHHDGTPRHESGMVDLNGSPQPGEVAATKKVPTWRKMLEGKATTEIVMDRVKGEDGVRGDEPVKGTVSANVPIHPTVVFDEKGGDHWLVPRKLAIEAATKNGWGDIFTAATKSAKSKQSAAAKKRGESEQAKKKLESAIGVAGMEALVVEISKRGVEKEAWPVMLEIALFHSADDALGYVCARRGLTEGKDDREKTIRALARKLLPAQIPSLVVELLLAGWMKLKGADAPAFAALAKVYGIDMAALRAETKARVGEKKKPKAKPKPDKPERPIRDVICELAPKHGVKGLIELDDLAMKVCGKCLVVLQGPELTALLDAIKALPVVEKKAGKRRVAEGAEKKRGVK